MLSNSQISAAVQVLEPVQYTMPLDEQYMDDIASAFGQVVDAKSPFTAGHSERVGFYADLIAQELGLPTAQCHWIKRAALLHDVGMGIHVKSARQRFVLKRELSPWRIFLMPSAPSARTTPPIHPK